MDGAGAVPSSMGVRQNANSGFFLREWARNISSVYDTENFSQTLLICKIGKLNRASVRTSENICTRPVEHVRPSDIQYIRPGSSV
jgi:hypothetical protein